MKIFISESDRTLAKRTALEVIAKFFSIPEPVVIAKNEEELLECISSIENKDAKKINKLLKEYFTAYDNWFNFYNELKIKESEHFNQNFIEYNLTENEKGNLADLIKKREMSLNRLQENFDELQLKRNNKFLFGNNSNVTGIS